MLNEFRAVSSTGKAVIYACLIFIAFGIYTAVADWITAGWRIVVTREFVGILTWVMIIYVIFHNEQTLRIVRNETKKVNIIK